MSDLLNKIYNEDCLEGVKRIPDGSVDLILTDPPYGTIKNADLGKHDTTWDVVIEPKKIYDIANRVLRKNGKMVLFGNEPFSSKLINESIPNVPFSYRMIWLKDQPAFSMYIGCKKRPMSFYEDILVFSKTHDIDGLHPLRQYFLMVMDYIGLNLKQINQTLGHRRAEHTFYVGSTQFGLCTETTYGELIQAFGIDKMEGFKPYSELEAINGKYLSTFNLWEGKKYKSNILKYKKDYDGFHPTQKPVALLEDLIKTYSNPGDVVVDLTIGSGSTAIACMNTNRNYIGFELDEEYYRIATERIKSYTPEMELIL